MGEHPAGEAASHAVGAAELADDPAEDPLPQWHGGHPAEPGRAWSVVVAAMQKSEQPQVRLRSRMSNDLLTIGELAARTGVAVSALRYYEEVGLVAPETRQSGHRRYRISSVQLVGEILLLQEVGFSLREMKALHASGWEGPGDWRDLARLKMADLEERITKAQAARSALQHALDCAHTNLLDCPKFAAAVEARLAGTRLEASHPH
jgi:DNA-binding transcriptional MerR regulator